MSFTEMDGYVVTNKETLNGEVFDHTTRIFAAYETAEIRFHRLVDAAFQETHPKGEMSDDEYADALSDFVSKHVVEHLEVDGISLSLDYEHENHKIEITLETYTEPL